MFEYRLYIDESGDHSYKHVSELDKRYLGLTGILINKRAYDTMFQAQLEQLKQVYFHYDIDAPPILVRREIIDRKGVFIVLRNRELNAKWEYSILNYFASLIPYAQVFTVVVDKEKHIKKFPVDTFDPYKYGLVVLLRRVRGYLKKHGQADVLAEARGNPLDKQLKTAYRKLHTGGERYGGAEEYQEVFPAEDIMVKRKDQNVAGIQIADLLVTGQTLETILKHGKPPPHQPSAFTKRLNSVVAPMINKYGQYLLE